MFDTSQYIGIRGGNSSPVVSMDSEEAGFRFWTPVVILLVALAFSGIIHGEQGIKDNQHIGPVPPAVTMITPDLYLVDNDAKVVATELCLHGDGNLPPVEEIIRVDRLDGELVECTADQQWNVKAEPAQSFIPDGLVHTLLQPWYWVLAGVMFLVFTPWTYFFAFREVRKLKKVSAEAQKDALKSARDLLVAQWAKSPNLDIDDPGFISDQDFEKRLGELDAKINRSV